MIFNIRTRTKGEFELAVAVMEVFLTDAGEEDEIDVNEFEGDDAIAQAKRYIESVNGTLGVIT